jgi:hypothetical protein
MAIALIIFSLLVIIWAIATCSAGGDDDIEFLIAENNRLKKELTILRNYIHFNNLECDVMAYYGRNDESEVKE